MYSLIIYIYIRSKLHAVFQQACLGVGLILFYFFTSGLFIFEEFIEELKAKVKAPCAVKPQDPSGSVKLGRTCSQTLSF